MSNSINTNSSAMTGLQRLAETRASMNKIQHAISTGKKVDSPKDDAATLAIAQQMMAAFTGTEAVREGLSRASATADVAIAAGQVISDTLIEMKSIAVQANQEGLDETSRNALNAAFQELKQQVTTITESADFAGTNLIAQGATDQNILSDEKGGRISVAAQDMSTDGLAISALSLDDMANSASALSGLDAAITDASAKLANLGSSAQRLETQNTYLGRQNDTLKAGIGNLVDADMAGEAAALEATKVKQALGAISLNIANAAPNRLLALFN